LVLRRITAAEAHGPPLYRRELFHQTANKVGGDDSTGFNFGAIYDFNEHDHFVFSASRGLQHPDTTNGFSWYVGFLLTGP
jgi:hypothetical protein